MVRLMLTFTPVVCVLSAIAFSECFSGCLFEVRETRSNKIKDDDRSQNGNSNENKRNMYDKAGKSHSIRKIRNDSKEIDAIGSNLRTVAFILLTMLLVFFVIHCTWVTSNAYSSPSIVLASYSGDGYVIFYSNIFNYLMINFLKRSRVILDDFREAYYWLSQNTDDDARVMSWWDYG